MRHPFVPPLRKGLPIPHPPHDGFVVRDTGAEALIGPRRAVNIEYGGAGVNVGVMVGFADVVINRLGLHGDHFAGASSGGFMAIAECLGLDIETKRDWTMRMPKEALAPGQMSAARLLEGARRGGFVDGPGVLRTYVETILREQSSVLGIDVTTFGAAPYRDRNDPSVSRLQLSMQLGTHNGMRVGRVSPDEHTALVAELAANKLTKIASQAARLRFPRIQQVLMPAAAEAMGFGPAEDIRVADVMAACGTLFPLMDAVTFVAPPSGEPYVAFDGGSGADVAFNPDARIRDFSWQKLPRQFCGPGDVVSPLPVVGFHVGLAGHSGSVVHQGQPELGIRPSLVFKLPPRFKVLQFNISNADLAGSIDWGGELAHRVLDEDLRRGDEHSVEAYFRNYEELVQTYKEAEGLDSKSPEVKGWYSALYDIGVKRVSALPGREPAGALDFRSSSLG